MNDSREGSFCVLPWIAQHVTTTGNITPCCEYKGSLGNLTDQTLQESWNGKDLQELKQKFLSGEQVEGCWKCFDRDKNEGESLRQSSNEIFAHWIESIRTSENPMTAGPEYPTTIDFRFSNLCNFKCRSCWHGSSSKWFSDAKAMGLLASDKAEIKSFNNSEDVAQQIEPYLNDLEDIYFAGGEPIMTAEHYNVLSLLIEHQRTDIKLRYTSNMSITQFNGNSIFELWKKFENVKLEASIDAPGERGELIRKGFDWETYKKHIAELRQACPHVELRFGITVSIFNIFTIPQLFDALIEFCHAKPSEIYVHPLQEPIFYRSQILPSPAKKEVSKIYKKYISALKSSGKSDVYDVETFEGLLKELENYMHAEDHQSEIEKFKSYSRKLDSLRSENCEQIFPELDKVWNYKVPFWKKVQRRVRSGRILNALSLRR